MTRLIVLGAGHPVYTPDRWGTSYLLEGNGEWVMVDCGPAATYKMYRAGVAPTQVNHLFFSHFHSDHVSDYPCFLMTRFDQSVGAEGELRVYGPPPIREMTDKIWSPDGAFWCDVTARINHPLSQQVYAARGGTLPRPAPEVRVHEIRPGQVTHGNGWKFTAFEVNHAQPFLNCYGFRAETEAGVVGFSGDGALDDALLPIAQGADLFVMAAMGFAARSQRLRGAALAQEASVGQLVISHLSPSVARAKGEILADIQTHYSGPVTWATDLMEMRL